jgi:hypothetical protein
MKKYRYEQCQVDSKLITGLHISDTKIKSAPNVHIFVYILTTYG